MKPSFLWLSPFLTAIGQKLGIDAHYFAKNSAFALTGHIISIVRTFLSGYLVARLFSTELYGEYQFILSVVGMLTLFTLPGLAQSVARAWARNTAFSMHTIIYKQVRVCLIGSAILLGAIPFLGYYNRQELWPLFVAAALAFPLTPVAQVVFGGHAIGKARFDTALRANIVWSSLMIVATAGIVFFYQSSMLMLLASMSIASLTYLYFSKTFALPKEEKDMDRKNTASIMRYAWGLTFSSLPINAVWYIDKLLISQLFGMKQLAVFSVALLIPEQIKILSKQLMPIAFSKQATGDDNWSRRIKLVKAVGIGTAVFAVGIALYILLSPWLIPFLFPNYNASDLVLLTNVAAATLITNPGSLFAQYLEAQGMLREIRLSNWIAAAVFAIAIVTLIPTYGLLGAVFARGIFRLTYLGTSLYFILFLPLQKSAP